MKKIKLLCVIALFLLLSTIAAAQEEDGDWQFFGLEGEKLFNLGSGILSAVLFTLTFLAFKRTGQNRLLCVSLAFFLFAIKGFLGAHELFFEEWTWVDPVAAVLQFAILLSFFWGIIRK